MKLLHKIIFWSHLLAGLIGGLVIFIMSATGVILNAAASSTLPWSATAPCVFIRASIATSIMMTPPDAGSKACSRTCDRNKTFRRRHKQKGELRWCN